LYYFFSYICFLPIHLEQMLWQSLPYCFLPTFPKAKFSKKKSIYSSKFYHNFYLSKSSFTCPRLRASGLARRLLWWKFYLITDLILLHNIYITMPCFGGHFVALMTSDIHVLQMYFYLLHYRLLWTSTTSYVIFGIKK